MREDRRRFGGALGASATLHALLAIGWLIALGLRPAAVATQTPLPHLDVVYLPIPGPSGGGGGSPVPAPRRPLEVPRHAAPPPAPVVSTTPPPTPPPPTLDAAIQTSAATVLRAAGTSAVSLEGGGGGTGAGLGSGRNDGAGPGSRGGAGGGPMRAGDGTGITPPLLLHSVDPRYTSEAMAAKLQGSVELEAVVHADGSVGELKVTRSLDRQYGLDAEAIRAARLWRFRPATRNGVAIDVYVTLILEFRLH